MKYWWMYLQSIFLFMIPPPIIILYGDIVRVMFRHSWARQYPMISHIFSMSSISWSLAKSIPVRLDMDRLATIPSRQSPWNGQTPLNPQYYFGCLFTLTYDTFLHDVPTLGMSQPMHGVVVADHTHANPSPNRHIGQGFIDFMATKLQLSKGCSVDISFNSKFFAFYFSLEEIQDWGVLPGNLGSGGNVAILGAFFVQLEWPEAAYPHKMDSLFITKRVIDGLRDFSEGLDRSVSDSAADLLDQFEVYQVASFVELRLAKGDVVIGTPQLDPYEQVVMISLRLDDLTHSLGHDGDDCGGDQSNSQGSEHSGILTGFAQCFSYF